MFKILISYLSLTICFNAALLAETPIVVGWIGGITGPTAKYSAQSSAILAMEEINSKGGINGRPLKIIFEDGQGNGTTAVTAATKLIKQDGVRYIVGGHCTPESLPISSLADKNKVIMLAAITSSPKLTSAGDYVFRVTAVSTTGVDLIIPFAEKKSQTKNAAVIYELTEYAEPLAERFKDQAVKAGMKISLYEGLQVGSTDFRTLLLKIKSANVDTVYLSLQSPDSAVIFKQIAEISLKANLYGNEITGNAVSTWKGDPAVFNGMVFAEPEFDLEDKITHKFIEDYKIRFKTDNIPYGIWSAEAYDAVKLLSEKIAVCGEDPEEVKKCLYATQNYQGASGSISFDNNGDGIRKYTLKAIDNGKIAKLN